MKQFALIALLLLTTIVPMSAAPAAKKLKVTLFTYDFDPNLGIGENGSVNLAGSGFGGSTTMGTQAGWTVGGNTFLPGQTIVPVTNILEGPDQGDFFIDGLDYLWPMPMDPVVPTNYARAAFEISGQSFTFPPIPSSEPGLWTVQVGAKALGMDGRLPTITLGLWPDGTETTRRLQIPPGRLTLTWSYTPAGDYCSAGCYQLVSGYFAARVKKQKQ